MTSSYFFKQSLFTWLYAWWPFGHRKTCWCALKSKWIHTHTPTHPFHSTLPHVAAPANLSLFLSLRKDHRNIGMLLLETSAMAYSIMHILKIHVCVQSLMHILCKHTMPCKSTSEKSLQFIIYFVPPTTWGWKFLILMLQSGYYVDLC